MNGSPVIPTIRVRDMGDALEFYQSRLEFSVDRGGPTDDNVAISRDGARMMIEVPAALYSKDYNDVIKQRMGSTSPLALYIEAQDLEEFYVRLTETGVKIVDPLADRPWGQAEFTIEDVEGNWLTFWKAPAD